MTSLFLPHAVGCTTIERSTSPSPCLVGRGGISAHRLFALPIWKAASGTSSSTSWRPLRLPPTMSQRRIDTMPFLSLFTSFAVSYSHHLFFMYGLLSLTMSVPPFVKEKMWQRVCMCTAWLRELVRHLFDSFVFITVCYRWLRPTEVVATGKPSTSLGLRSPTDHHRPRKPNRIETTRFFREDACRIYFSSH